MRALLLEHGVSNPRSFGFVLRSENSASSNAQLVCHYFMMPAPLRNVPKHTVMAEGDFVV